MMQVNISSFTLNGREILRNIRFELKEPSLVLLAGSNASGKTTLLNVISGLYPGANRMEKLFLIPSRRMFPKAFTLWKWRDFCRRFLFGFDEKTFDRLLQDYRFDPNSERDLNALSPGRISAMFLITAFSSGFPFLVMDEPFSHLDPRLIELTQKEILRELLAGRKILLSTHYLEEFGEMSDRILILHKGHLIYDGSLERAREEMREVIVENPSDKFLSQDGILAYRKHENGMVGILVKEDEAGRKIPGKRYYLNLRDLYLYLIQKKEEESES